MTIVVTRDVPARFRGFLASVMLEIAPGVYTSPRMDEGVRSRVWDVLEGWYYDLGHLGSIIMTWRDSSQPSGQAVRTLGLPPKELFDHEGLLLVRKPV